MQISSYLSERERAKQCRRRRLWGICALGAGGLAVIGAAWLVRYAPIFNVRNIVVEGNSHVSAEEVLAVAQSIVLEGMVGKLLGVERLFAWPEGTRTNLALLPAVSDLSFSKSFRTRTVRVAVEEREPVGVWCRMSRINADTENTRGSASVCWWFDREGILFRRALDGEGGLVKTVHDYSGRSLGIGMPVLAKEPMDHLLEVFEVMRASEATIREVKLGAPENEEVEVVTHRGPRFYFSVRFPLGEAAQIVREIFANSGKFPDAEKIEYVDMRVENRVYYK